MHSHSKETAGAMTGKNETADIPKHAFRKVLSVCVCVCVEFVNK